MNSVDILHTSVACRAAVTGALHLLPTLRMLDFMSDGGSFDILMQV